VRPAVSDQLICLTDVVATCAEILGVRLPDEVGEDSFSFLPVLEGRGASARESVVHHSISGAFAIRRGPWKLALSPGSGGWSAPRDPEARQQGLPETQLYRIGAGDLAERENVAARHPEIVAELEQTLQRLVEQGRSTPGRVQPNAVPVVLRKPVPAPTAKAKRKS
jgi:arylsulfatase A-like enzyme